MFVGLPQLQSFDPRFRTAYTLQYNLSLQRELPWALLVEVAYVGTRGQRIWINRNRNAVSTQYLSLGAQLDATVANPFFGLIPGNLGASRTTTQAQRLRPFGLCF